MAATWMTQRQQQLLLTAARWPHVPAWVREVVQAWVPLDQLARPATRANKERPAKPEARAEPEVLEPRAKLAELEALVSRAQQAELVPQAQRAKLDKLVQPGLVDKLARQDKLDNKGPRAEPEALEVLERRAELEARAHLVLQDLRAKLVRQAKLV